MGGSLPHSLRSAQGNFTREGTLFSNLFVLARSARSQLMSSKSVGKSIVSTLEKPHLPTLLAADPLIPEHDTLHTMQLLSVSLPLLKLPWPGGTFIYGKITARVSLVIRSQQE